MSLPTVSRRRAVLRIAAAGCIYALLRRTGGAGGDHPSHVLADRPLSTAGRPLKTGDPPALSGIRQPVAGRFLKIPEPGPPTRPQKSRRTGSSNSFVGLSRLPHPANCHWRHMGLALAAAGTLTHE